MNPTNSLQQQFPLSPRKFWKKMFSQIIGTVIFGLIIGPSLGGLYFAVTQADFDLTLFITISIVVFAIFAAVLLIPYALYVKAYIRRYFYSGEDYFMTIKKGVFAPAEIHVQYQKIQDVYVDQDIIDRIMGLYDVHIASATAASGIEAHIDGVEKAAADGLKKFLLDKFSNVARNAEMPRQSQDIPGQSSQGQPVQAPASQSSSVHLSEEISSARYPLSGKWLAVEVINRILRYAITAALLLFFFIARFFDSTSASQATGGYVLLIYVGITLISVVWAVASLLIWKHNYAFNFMPDHIYYKDGVIGISEKHMPYSSIQDVTIKQGVLDRMVGLADVRIENAAQSAMPMQMNRRGAMPTFNGVIIQGLSLADANKITDILKTQVLGKNTSKYGL